MAAFLFSLISFDFSRASCFLSAYSVIKKGCRLVEGEREREREREREKQRERSREREEVDCREGNRATERERQRHILLAEERERSSSWFSRSLIFALSSAINARESVRKRTDGGRGKEWGNKRDRQRERGRER